MTVSEEKPYWNKAERYGNETERNNLFDIAKGMGILLVVIGHMHHFFEQDSITYILIYSFHMPLFIAVTGALISDRKEKTSDYVKKRFRSIIVPYWTAAIFSILYAWPADSATVRKYVGSILLGNTANGNLEYNVPLWYLPMIFCASVIFWELCKISRERKYLLFFLVSFCSALGYVLIKHNIRLPWGLETALISQVIMFGGRGLSKIKEQYDGKEYIWILLLTIVCVFAFVYSALANGRVDMNAGAYRNIVLFFVNASLGIVIVMNICVLLRRIPVVWRWMAFLGKNSLYIMMFHVPMASFVQGDILNIMPAIVRDNLWNKNVIGIFYWLFMSIAVSLLMGCIWENLLKRERH